MTCDAQTEQQLWELLYELLPDDEAAELRARITTDPDVARAYAKVKQLSEVVALGARFDDADPAKKPFRGASIPSAAAVAPATSRGTWRRVAHWVVGVAAVGLLCIAGYGSLRWQSPRNASAARQLAELQPSDFPVVQVATPGEMGPGVDNQIWVRARDASGRPLQTEVEFFVNGPRQEPLFRLSGQTDAETGAATFAVPGDVVAKQFAGGQLDRVELVARAKASPPVTVDARWIRAPYLTYLTVDRPTYAPGETVRYRSLTLSRFALEAADALPITYSVAGPQRQPVEGLQDQLTIEQGVGDGQFQLPPNAPAGEYQLTAESLSKEFPAQQQRFWISAEPMPKLKKTLRLARDSYAPGDDVNAELRIERSAEGPAEGAEVSGVAIIDGVPLEPHLGPVKADELGRQVLAFRLPDQINDGDGLLKLEIVDGETREQLTASIPIQVEGIEVDFYPEGGELVSGLPSRVYFFARDKQDRPAACRGSVVDSTGQVVAEAATDHAGRGVFALTPQAGQSYVLVVEEASSSEQRFTLPEPAADGFLVLDAGPGVFDRGAPLELRVRSTRAAPRLVVQAHCRGESVGLRAVDQQDFVPAGPDPVAPDPAGPNQYECTVRLPLADTASGVIRITVFDYGTPEPRPLAERLVYRRPSRQLHARLDDLATVYAPGSDVRLKLRATNENNEPIAAIWGVSVVDEATFPTTGETAPDLETFFYLASSIDHAGQLEDANFYLREDEPAAARALDLLLATQGWRKFVTAEQFAEVQQQFGRPPALQSWAMNDADFAASAPFATESLAASESLEGAALGGGEHLMEYDVALADTSLPVLADNHAELAKWFAAETTTMYGLQETTLRTLGKWLFAASLLLILAVAALVAARWLTLLRVWVPATLVAAMLLLVGMMWMTARVGSRGEIVYGVIEGERARPTTTSAPASAAVDATRVESEARDAFFEMEVAEEEADSPAIPALSDEPSAGAAGDLVVVEQQEQRQVGATRESSGRSQASRAPVADGFGAGGGAAKAPRPPEADDAPRSRVAAPGRGVVADSERRRTDRPAAETSRAAPPARAEPDVRSFAQPRTAPQATAPVPAAEPADAVPLAEAPAETASPNALGLAPAPKAAPTAPMSPVASSELSMGASDGLRAAATSPLPQTSAKYYFRAFAPQRRALTRELGETTSGVAKTPVWQPRVITDANGEADVWFTVPPDRETTYRVLADGHAAGRIGSYRNRFAATLDDAPLDDAPPTPIKRPPAP